MTEDLLGQYRIEDIALARRLTIDTFDALSAMHAMTALLELDVTRASTQIAQVQDRGLRVSLFAHVVRSIAVASSRHPKLNVVRHGRKVARFEDVDVSVPVEVSGGAGRLPLQMVIRAAQHKLAPQIYAEIAEAKERHRQEGALGSEDRWARRMLGLTRLVPRRIEHWLIRRMVADGLLPADDELRT